MNECFFIGKVIENVEFKFINQKKGAKYYSVSLFELELLDKNIIKIKAYNELADFCYSKLKKNNFIFIEGKIETEGVIATSFIRIILNKGK